MATDRSRFLSFVLRGGGGGGAEISCNTFYSAILLGVKLVVFTVKLFHVFFFQINFVCLEVFHKQNI